MSALLLQIFGCVMLDAAPYQGRGGDSDRANLASISQDVAFYREQMGQMRLEMEALRSELNQLKSTVQSYAQAQNQLTQNYNDFVHNVQKQIDGVQGSMKEQQQQTLSQINKQVDSIADKIQTTMTAQEKAAAKRSSGGGKDDSFTDDYPKTGVSYTVIPGDTLSKIAKQHHATVRDIQNANRISNPNDLRVGQTLFIPQRN